MFRVFPCSTCQSCSLAAVFSAALTGTALQFALQSCSICSSLLSGAFPVPEWSTAEPEYCVAWPRNSRSTLPGWFMCMCRVQVEACWSGYTLTPPCLPCRMGLVTRIPLPCSFGALVEVVPIPRRLLQQSGDAHALLQVKSNPSCLSLD